MRSVIITAAAALAFVVVGCSSPGAVEESASTESAFRSWTSSLSSCAIASSHEPAIKMCLTGNVSAEDLERSKLWARRSMLTWLRVTKSIDDAVTGTLAFDCANPHITFRLLNGRGTSYAHPSVVNVYMTRPFGTWTHELGHAFAGLLDTYSGPAGTCMTGQPQSLMCWGAYGPRANPDAWSTLWQDDIAGIQSNHRKLFGTSTTPAPWPSGAVDLEASIDPDDPWPTESAPANEAEDTDVVIDPTRGATEIDQAADPRSVDL